MGRQMSILDSFQNLTKYTKESVKHKSITNKITNLLLRQMLPISLVDSEEWTSLLKELDHRYECPSRKYFSENAIPSKSIAVKEAIIEDLKNTTSVCCTTDGWTSINTDPYLSLTVHFLTPTWQLRTYCLRTIYLPDSHTGKNIAGMIRTILAEFNLVLEDVTTITTDNGSNMKVAAKELRVIRMPCFGHILHNAINFATRDIAEVTDMLKECKSLVSTLNHSYK